MVQWNKTNEWNLYSSYLFLSSKSFETWKFPVVSYLQFNATSLFKLTQLSYQNRLKCTRTWKKAILKTENVRSNLMKAYSDSYQSTAIMFVVNRPIRPDFT